MKIEELKWVVSAATWRDNEGRKEPSIPNIITFLNQELQQGISPWNVKPVYFLERFPIVGFLVSIPAMIAFGALSTYYVARDFFSEKGPENKDDLAACAVAYSVLCLNQLLNICTGGILNNLFAYKLSQTEQSTESSQQQVSGGQCVETLDV